MTPPRPPGAEDAIAGVMPRLVLEPATLEEAVEAMQACARDRMKLAFLGGGTDIGLGSPPSALDAVLRTRGLVRVVEHAPSDQIVTVEAGLPLAELQRRLAPHRQRLALDPPLPERATCGGVVAANAFGPLRTRYGGVRDLVIGISMVRADGVLARGGGKVVKNVAGFDLPRLMVGSLGTLGLIASVTFRLHPLPEAAATFAVDGVRPAAIRGLATAIRAAQLEPAAAAALCRDGRWMLGMRFEGFAPGVREQGERLMALATGAALRCEALDEAGAAAFWGRHDAVRAGGPLRVKMTAPPSSLEALAEGAVSPLLEALSGGAAVLYPTVGAGFASGAPADAARALAALSRAREAARARGGSVVLCAGPFEVLDRADPWGPPPAAFPVMRRLKEQLDPEHRLAPGRFVGGL